MTDFISTASKADICTTSNFLIKDQGGCSEWALPGDIRGNKSFFTTCQKYKELPLHVKINETCDLLFYLFFEELREVIMCGKLPPHKDVCLINQNFWTTFAICAALVIVVVTLIAIGFLYIRKRKLAQVNFWNNFCFCYFFLFYFVFMCHF